MKIGTKNLDRISAPLAVAACTGILLTGSTAHAADPASGSGRSASCPTPGQFPPIGHDPKFTDGNVALFAGGSYSVDGGGAEAEGLLVVGGDASFAKNPGGVFNVGRAGAGSGILPAGGELMLAVGGRISVAKGTTVDVGAGLFTGPGYGGTVQAGGAVDGQGAVNTNGGDLRPGLGADRALAPYTGFAATVREQSSQLGALPPTGTAKASGGSVTFRSTGPSRGKLQVFEIAGADLDGASTFVFENIPADASVLVNVTGPHPVSVSPMAVGYNGERVDVYSSAHFGEAAAKVLYNLRETPQLTLGGGGNFIGSLLAPKASADLTASTNGRLYVGGDVKMHGSGNETHNYPWTGTPVFDCTPAPAPPPSAPASPAPTPSGSAPATPTAPPPAGPRRAAPRRPPPPRQAAGRKPVRHPRTAARPGHLAGLHRLHRHLRAGRNRRGGPGRRRGDRGGHPAPPRLRPLVRTWAACGPRPPGQRPGGAPDRVRTRAGPPPRVRADRRRDGPCSRAVPLLPDPRCPLPIARCLFPSPDSTRSLPRLGPERHAVPSLHLRRPAARAPRGLRRAAAPVRADLDGPAVRAARPPGGHPDAAAAVPPARALPPTTGRAGRVHARTGPAGRRPGAHRRRPWTLRRTAVALASSGVLAVCGCGLGAALLAPAHTDRAVPAPLAVTFATEPPAAPSSPAPSSPAPGTTARPSDPPSSAAPHRTPPRSTTAPAPTTAPPPPAAVPVTTPPTPAATRPATPGSSPSAPVLRFGDSGPQVRRLQLRLLELACYPPPFPRVSGTFDDWTQAVLTSFQRRAGIRGEDGVFGPATRAAVDAAAPHC
ncbi:choice-of-anchor A family protein [Kitasatospora cheerisanensis]|uniref:Uncharacterized protein n=1 Tax=Kitasatospora cheerisanensis KCTC 2395 TaxID=1348663 RepID=A0A066YVA3_9ACTN|nr:choice-of-anchor A family protein [Kitasatospora cheerisanensis]KDN82021.1 hypothetical protein KCH_61750 [Kitasatospora cheerisanensis KCTC 2395]